MEFWGIEVKPGKPFKVAGEEGTLVHISQASLGDCKGKKEEFVPLYVEVDNQKLVLGTLSTQNIPQLSCDLVFEKGFELSHNWGKGSVYFTGYTTPNPEDLGEDFSDSEEEDEEVPAPIAANGNAVAKPKAKPAEVKKDVKVDDHEEADLDSEEGMDDSDDEDDSEEEEETPTPKKPESSKKRANEAAPKSPVSAKKAKATEEKKKGGPATPHPAKKGGKTPATATQSPKSASQVSCGSCKKTFNSGNALEAHNKAKHSAAK